MFYSKRRWLEEYGNDIIGGDQSEKHNVEVGGLNAFTANSKYGITQRALKSRRIHLIAIGGCIGTVHCLCIHLCSFANF